MRNDAQPSVPAPLSPDLRLAGSTSRPLAPTASTEARLASAAAATARRLGPVATDWPADEFGAIVYASALVDLKSALPADAFAECERHYRAHRKALLAQLPRVG